MKQTSHVENLMDFISDNKLFLCLTSLAAIALPVGISFAFKKFSSKKVNTTVINQEAVSLSTNTMYNGQHIIQSLLKAGLDLDFNHAAVMQLILNESDIYNDRGRSQA